MSRPLRLRSLQLLFIAALSIIRVEAQVTETPQTIEPGKFLVRMDAFSFGVKQDSSSPDVYKALGVANTLISGGLTDNLDFEVGAQLFLRDTLQIHGSNLTQDGIGDVTFRSKWTFWRDNSLEQAAAIIPVIKIPTSSNGVGNDHVEGGLILPWAANVGGGLTAGAMIEWDQLRNVANTRYDSRWFAGGVISWKLSESLGAYAESTQSISTAGTSTYAGTLGLGATLYATKNFQWDFEVSKILGQAATDWGEVLRFRWKL